MTDSQHEAWLANREERLTEERQREQEVMSRPLPGSWESMTFPAICRHCAHVHDAGKAETVQRYTDCSVWRCPACKTLIDDRPHAWGGSITGQEARTRLSLLVEQGWF